MDQQPSTLDKMDRCDHLDVLEESATFKRRVFVELKGGDSFTDTVRDVVTENGEDWAVFAERGRIGVKEIRSCGRADVKES
ncbi:MAG: hypothetical protein ACK4N5_11210 [Myxococcales bacterium]